MTHIDFDRPGLGNIFNQSEGMCRLFVYNHAWVSVAFEFNLISEQMLIRN
jgi:hypothetical protein